MYDCTNKQGSLAVSGRAVGLCIENVTNKLESKKMRILCNLLLVFTFYFPGEISCICKHISSYVSEKYEGKAYLFCLSSCSYIRLVSRNSFDAYFIVYSTAYIYSRIPFRNNSPFPHFWRIISCLHISIFFSALLW